MKKKLKIALYIILALLLIDFLLPTKIQNPVEGCGRESYNQKSFWHPWGDHMHNVNQWGRFSLIIFL